VGRVADHLQARFLGILDAAVIVPDLLFFGVVIQGVDREIAPRRVLLLAAEDVVAQQHAVGGGDAVVSSSASPWVLWARKVVTSMVSWPQ
jgi:hypothetical protein